MPACVQTHHSPAIQPARTRCRDQAGGPAASLAIAYSMKKPSRRVFKMKLRKARKENQAANESVALFLGPKLLGELRILMRLASDGRATQGVAKDVPLKSY